MLCLAPLHIPVNTAAPSTLGAPACSVLCPCASRLLLQPPSSWASALSQPRGEDQARQGWRQLACLLRELEHAGHLLPGQAAKALYLARTLKASGEGVSCWALALALPAPGLQAQPRTG